MKKVLLTLWTGLLLVACNTGNNDEVLKSYYIMELSYDGLKKTLGEINAELIDDDFIASRREKKLEVSKKSKELCRYIEEIKATLVSESGGRKSEDSLLLSELNNPNDTKTFRKVINLSEMQEKISYDLAEWGETVISFTYLDYEKLDKEVEGIMLYSGFEANGKKGEISLDQLPLAGVMAMLTKLQCEIKRLEYELLTTLQSHRKCGGEIFARVVAPSSYIMAGSFYEADIIAWMSLHELKRVVINGEEIPIGGFAGRYKVQAPNFAGVHKVEGFVEIETAEGTEKHFFAPTEWQSFVPAASIDVGETPSVVALVETPVTVSAAGFRQEDIIVSVKHGTIKKGKKLDEYTLVIDNPNITRTTLKVQVKMPDGSLRTFAEKELKVVLKGG